jgi:hypothetical protein
LLIGRRDKKIELSCIDGNSWPAPTRVVEVAGQELVLMLMVAGTVKVIIILFTLMKYVTVI